jgi:hypothetical protein
LKTRPQSERERLVPTVATTSHRDAPRGLATVSARFSWVIVALLLVAGVVCRGIGFGIVALWLFVAASVVVALILPFQFALASPLFMGIFGWLVDMLPLVVLIGWSAVVVRWLVGLLRERRRPEGGRWIWVPIGLFLWTGLGVLVVSSIDFKHFLLLLGIQFVASGVMLAVVDTLADIELRIDLASTLVAYAVVLTVGVALAWVGVPFEGLQDDTVSDQVETAYGVDAFQNNVGMIKYARNKNAGAGEWRQRMRTFANNHEGLPPHTVILPKFHVYDEYILIRFDGSARAYEGDLDELGVDLLYDNVGLAPANLVPRWRSFPRNALTYAGVCAAVLPFALFLAWAAEGRRKLLGRVGVFACLFGAGFAIARGAWVAILLGIIYLAIDGTVTRRLKIEAVAAFGLTAVLLTAVFFVLYRSDPLTARATGESSIVTREELYADTVASVNEGVHLFLGYGTEQPRLESGTTQAFGTYGKYVPRAGSHSTYLNYLFRAGVVGALLIAALYISAGLHARAAARERSGRDGAFSTLATMAVVIAAGHAVILSLFVEPIYTLAISLVLGLAMAGSSQLNRSIFPWRART